MKRHHKRRNRRSRKVRLIRIGIILGAFLGFFWITGCMERMFYYPQKGPTPPPAQLRVESVWFESADGTRLHGWFIPAEGRLATDPPAPSVLHVHGNAGNITSHAFFTEHLPPAGFNVFIFDFRGYGESEGRPTRRGPLIDDTDAAIDALLARADVDADRIGMYAQSLGGGIGLNVMARRSEIRAAVFESSFASWREAAASAVGGASPGPFARGIAAMLIPDTDRPDDAIRQIKRPILLLHGTADTIIPAAHSRRLDEAGGDNVTLVELAEGEHNTLRMTHPEIDKLMIEFLREHLAPTGAAGR